MKKSLILLFALLISISNASADKLIVKDFKIPQGGQAYLTINYQFDEANLYSGFQFSLTLPEGLSTVKNETGNPSFKQGDCYDTSYTISSSSVNGIDNFVALSLQSVPLKGKSGVLMEIPIIGLETLNIGEEFTAQLSGIQFGNVDGVNTSYFENVSFTITITEAVAPYILLDEDSNVIPEATEESILLKVKRSIVGNQWNTICLPFAMTEQQVYEVFGSDVEIAEFMEYEANNELTHINVIFESALLDEDGFMANYPYIIKTSKDINEFEVESILEPFEEDAFVEFTNGRTGSRKEVYGTFYGTLKAGQTLENNQLFLNSGKFWYSAGKNTIKAFRGYFDFVDVLASKEASSQQMALKFRDSITGIEDIIHLNTEEHIYDLHGRIVTQTKKGVYIKGGKKYIVK